MNTAKNMQVINIDYFRDKIRKGEHAYTTGDRALTINEVLDKIGISRSTLDRWIKDGNFIPKRYFGPGSPRFMESEVDVWIERRERQNNAH